MSPVNVIVEDPKKENIIYVGTDNGAYVSINNGGDWHAFAKALSDDATVPLPAVAVHDMKIQKRENHLLLGTHGRSIYRTDISSIQNMDTSKNVQLFEVASTRFSPRWGNSFSMWRDAFEPSVAIQYYTGYAGKFSLVVKNEDGKELQRIPLTPTTGLNMTKYDLTINEQGKKTLEKANSELNIQKQKNGKYYLPKGKYVLTLDSGNNANAVSTELEVK